VPGYTSSIRCSGYKISNLGAPTGAAEALRYGDEGLVNHDALLNYVASKHLTLPAAIAAVLTDHTKAAHDALAINADQVDGEHAAAIVTDARVKAHFPDTLAAIISDLPVAAWATIFSSAFPVATVLSDHNLAAHPLAIVPTMDDAHVPDLNTLSGFPATDPAAGTGGLRTLGTGAQQAAAGNHVHTLQEDISAEATPGTNDYATDDGYKWAANCSGASDVVLATISPTFDALSRAVGAGFFFGHAKEGDHHKIRLYLGGVQVGESAYLVNKTCLRVAKGQRALSGAQECKVAIHNYDATPREYGFHAELSGTWDKGATVVVGSVKP